MFLRLPTHETGTKTPRRFLHFRSGFGFSRHRRQQTLRRSTVSLHSLFARSACALVLALSSALALAQAPAAKPRVVVLATGGTIAGAGASVVNSATYQA